MRTVRIGLLGACVALLVVAGAASANRERSGIELVSPQEGQLSLVGPVALELKLGERAKGGTVVVRVDGTALPEGALERHGRKLTGTLSDLAAGLHTVDVDVTGKRGTKTLSSWFELVELENPESCEVLNNASCLLPFPSSRYLERARTHTGYRVVYPADALPFSNRLEVPAGIPPAVLDTQRADPTHFLQNDGFSPTVQVLMNFPAGVDLEASNAPRIDRVTTRTYDERGLEESSPTLLMQRNNGRRINHWTENDVRVTDPSRRITFLRPGESLLPGHRYVVAVRNLVSPTGAPVEAEPVFAAIRDERPSDIPAVEKARRRIEPILRWLEREGVPREELILAFDFVVSSDHSLTHEMLSMRDQAFDWLEEQVDDGVQTFTVDEVRSINETCDPAGAAVWREIRGSFQVPLFLTSDPFTSPHVLGVLQRNPRGKPVWHTLTNAPYGIAIPCAALEAPQAILMLGHGLFGTGQSLVTDLTQSEELGGFDFVAGATNWSGLSGPDVEPSLLDSFIIRVISDVDQFEALPDRLRQGQLNTLVLARMLKHGVFHIDPNFRVDGRGVIDTKATAYYFGASLGGIMGTMFAALTPDVRKLNVDVPAINFSLLAPARHAVHPVPVLRELRERGPDGAGDRIRAEPRALGARRARRLREPRDGPAAGAAARRETEEDAGDGRLARPAGVESGLAAARPDAPARDARGLAPARPRGHARHDGHAGLRVRCLRHGLLRRGQPGSPALHPAVRQPCRRRPNRCDPHGLRGLIPASVDQLLGFLTPDGKIENFCADGVCDASEPNEIPFGAATPCDPLQ